MLLKVQLGYRLPLHILISLFIEKFLAESGFEHFQIITFSASQTPLFLFHIGSFMSDYRQAVLRFYIENALGA